MGKVILKSQYQEGPYTTDLSDRNIEYTQTLNLWYENSIVFGYGCDSSDIDELLRKRKI
jgi:hypothetical protein